jgi:hypothetical protein
MCCKCAAHVTISVILNICVVVRRDGTTAGGVAPGRNGLVPNRRAPKSGTAARATTLFGSFPKQATPTRARTTRTESTHQAARPVRDAARPEPGTARQRNRSCFATAFRGTHGVRFCGQQEQITLAVLEPSPWLSRSAERGRRSGAPGPATPSIGKRAPCPRVPDCRVPRNAMRTQPAGRTVPPHAWTTTQSISMRSPQ